MPEIKLCFILGDLNENGKPDLHAELSFGSMVFKTPVLDGPSLQEMVELVKKLAGLG